MLEPLNKALFYLHLYHNLFAITKMRLSLVVVCLNNNLVFNCYLATGLFITTWLWIQEFRCDNSCLVLILPLICILIKGQAKPEDL